MATRFLTLLLTFALLSGSGCATRPSPTPVPTPTPIPLPAPETTPPQEISLALWLPDELFLEGKPGKEVLEEEISSFEQAHPGVKVKVYIKKARGKGGITELLLSAREVAPLVLPDLVVMDASEAAWVGEGLFQPLEEAPEGLFPFAVNPNFVYLAADVDHLAFNTGMITSPLSSLLGAGEGGKGLLLFPSGEILAAQYLALGGRFPGIQEAPLAEALNLWQKGLESGAISPLSLELKGPEEGWKLYLSGKAAMVGVRASLFSAYRDKLRQTASAPLPSFAPVAWGWAAGIASREPERKRAARELVRWLLQPGRNREWALAANLLPVHREAYFQGGDPYLLFLSRLLESAHSAPPSTLLRPMGEALQRVLSGEATPEEAARSAAISTP